MTSTERILGAARLSHSSDVSSSIATQRAGIASVAAYRNATVVHITEDTDISGGMSPFDRPSLGPWLDLRQQAGPADPLHRRLCRTRAVVREAWQVPGLQGRVHRLVHAGRADAGTGHRDLRRVRAGPDRRAAPAGQRDPAGGGRVDERNRAVRDGRGEERRLQVPRARRRRRGLPGSLPQDHGGRLGERRGTVAGNPVEGRPVPGSVMGRVAGHRHASLPGLRGVAGHPGSDRHRRQRQADLRQAHVDLRQGRQRCQDHARCRADHASGLGRRARALGRIAHAAGGPGADYPAADQRRGVPGVRAGLDLPRGGRTAGAAAARERRSVP